MEPSVSPFNTASFLAQKAQLPLEELMAHLEQSKKEIRQDEEKGREQIEKLQADLFVARFPLYVQEGIMHWLELETKPLGSCEEPGAREHFLHCFRGLIAVYKFESKFQGSSNDLEFEAPGWLNKAIDILNEQGWVCGFKPYVFAECGIGNTLIVYFCIRDPRHQPV